MTEDNLSRIFDTGIAAPRIRSVVCTKPPEEMEARNIAAANTAGSRLTVLFIQEGNYKYEVGGDPANYVNHKEGYEDTTFITNITQGQDTPLNHS